MLTIVLIIASSVCALLSASVPLFFKVRADENHWRPTKEGKLAILFGLLSCVFVISQAIVSEHDKRDEKKIADEKQADEIKLRRKAEDELKVANVEIQSGQIELVAKTEELAKLQKEMHQQQVESTKIANRHNNKIELLTVEFQRDLATAREEFRAKHEATISELKMEAKLANARYEKLKQDILDGKIQLEDIIKKKNEEDKEKESWYRRELAQFEFPKGTICQLVDDNGKKVPRSTELYLSIDNGKQLLRLGTCGAGTCFELGTQPNLCGLVRTNSTDKTDGYSTFAISKLHNRKWIPWNLKFEDQMVDEFTVDYPLEQMPTYKVRFK